jgi:pimeloyl-ACP methyl ester carboxylesterase
VAEHAAAVGDFLDAMRLRQIDLLGHGFGALVAAELTATRTAQVRRLVLVSPPLGTDTTEAEPLAAAPDGSHLQEEWRRAMAYCGAGAPAGLLTAALAERLRNSAPAAAAATAERGGYPVRSRLAPLTVPMLVLRLRDDIRANKSHARDMPARTWLLELPEHGASLFETAPETAAQAVEAFLR